MTLCWCSRTARASHHSSISCAVLRAVGTIVWHSLMPSYAPASHWASTSTSMISSGSKLRFQCLTVGIRTAEQLAPSAFLASAAGCALLISSILPAGVVTSGDHWIDTSQAWRKLTGIDPNVVAQISSQAARTAMSLSSPSEYFQLPSRTISLKHASWLLLHLILVTGSMLLCCLR
jgi:hypothetical protein